MSQPLVVHVNRDDHHTLEPAARGFEASGPFVLRLENHGAGCHLHLTFHGDLAPGRALEDDNPYLDADGTLEVPVDVTSDLRPARGSVEIVTGYGQSSVTVEVQVTDGAGASPDAADGGTGAPAGAGGTVAGEPGPTPSPAGGSPGQGEDHDGGPVLPRTDAIRAAVPEFTAATALLAGLALLALVVAAAALRTIEGTAVAVGVLAVIGTVVGAGLYLLTR